MRDESVQAYWDCYEMKPGARFYRREFGYYCLDEWHEQGLAVDADFAKEFGYDQPGKYALGGLGWCEAAFVPAFPEKVLEDRGEYELIQDAAGRGVLVFKGRRSGFMPEYKDHPVKDRESWKRECLWRMDPDAPGRFDRLGKTRTELEEAHGKGRMISQQLIGGYMYLRSLMGPEEVLYMFYDNPGLIHDCMEAWLVLADRVTAEHQKLTDFDELYLAEDICYNCGSLISPDMMREFLFPYYRQLIDNIKSRRRNKSRHLYIQIDTDGYAPSVIPVYQEIGMDVMSPFEVASGCDVVEIGKQYPDLVIHGGIDKRVLAQGREAIDRHLDYILPAMKERGGYMPTCDHGVPAEVSLENYRYYRKRCLEF